MYDEFRKQFFEKLSHGIAGSIPDTKNVYTSSLLSFSALSGLNIAVIEAFPRGTRSANNGNAVRGAVIAVEHLHSGLGLPLTDFGADSGNVVPLFFFDSTPPLRVD